LSYAGRWVVAGRCPALLGGLGNRSCERVVIADQVINGDVQKLADTCVREVEHRHVDRGPPHPTPDL
jgi:hypothetical protein